MLETCRACTPYMRTDQDSPISIRGTDYYHPHRHLLCTVPTKPSCTCSSVASPPYPGCQSDIISSIPLQGLCGFVGWHCAPDSDLCSREEHRSTMAADGRYPPRSRIKDQTCPTRLVCSESCFTCRSVWVRSHHISSHLVWKWECCGFVRECSTRLGMSLSSPCNVCSWCGSALLSSCPFSFFFFLTRLIASSRGAVVSSLTTAGSQQNP